MRPAAERRFSARVTLMVVAFGFLVAGCGGGADEEAPSEQTVPLTAAPTATPAPPPTPPPTAEPTEVPVEPLAINHIQVIGSHNSYHLLPEPALFDALTELIPELAESREYAHRSLTEQLETFGIRQLEIDVFADPVGGLFSNPAANALVGLPALDAPELAEPGFKVLHAQDYDYSTTCLTLIACLEEIAAWSDANPSHLPLMIMVEYKSQSVPDAAAAEGVEVPVELTWTEPLAPTPALLDALEAEIRSVFAPDQIIEPDDLRDGAETLHIAIRRRGWPLLADSRGKVMFALIGDERLRGLYSGDAPNLQGRVMFTNSTPGDPDAAFMTIDRPDDILLEAAVDTGYLVRTRTDVPTGDARSNDTSRRDLALDGGAHMLSTDYYVPSEFFDTPYVVALPDGVVARCNPVSAPATCTDDQLSE